jgi:predicted DNA-binding protein (MmcQ/YjbR family)
MDIEELRDYCLSKPETTEDFPFDENTMVFKVEGKVFALTSLKKWEAGDHSLNLKCDPEKAVEYREKYPDVVFPGYHTNKKHWNTVVVDNSQLSPKFIKDLINHSYELVVSKLPKSKREELLHLLGRQTSSFHSGK